MMARSGRRLWPWTASRGRAAAQSPRAPWRRDQYGGEKRGDGSGSAGHQQQKGENVIALIDHHGDVFAPVPVAPVKATDIVLFPKGLKALNKRATEVGLDRRGAYRNRDGGFDAAHNRTCMFHAGLIPNITEKPRNRKTTKRGRKRLCNAAIHAWRMRIERTFAWQDTCKRLLLRFARIQQRHYGMKCMASTCVHTPNIDQVWMAHTIDSDNYCHIMCFDGMDSLMETVHLPQWERGNALYPMGGQR